MAYKDYADRLNRIAHGYFDSYRAHRAELDKSEQDYKEYIDRKRTGRLTDQESMMGTQGADAYHAGIRFPVWFRLPCRLGFLFRWYFRHFLNFAFRSPQKAFFVFFIFVTLVPDQCALNIDLATELDLNRVKPLSN